MKTLLALLALLISVPTHADPITYAPRQKVVQGVKNLTCVGVSFSNPGNWVDGQGCVGIGQHVADFYKMNSRGLVQIKPKGVGLKESFPQNPGNYAKAVNDAKAKFGPVDMLSVTGNPGTPHAGAGVAYLGGALYRDAEHENGHLLGLGHAGRYECDKGKCTLDAYGDGQSVMGRFPSAFLTGPQYYSRGWLFENEAALYTAPGTFQLRRITQFATKDKLALIVIPNKFFNPTEVMAIDEPAADDDTPAIVGIQAAKAGRDAYISFPPGCDKPYCAAIHLGIANGAGTQKVATFSNEFFDTKFTGLHVKILAFDAGLITVSVDFAKPPAVAK